MPKFDIRVEMSLEVEAETLEQALEAAHNTDPSELRDFEITYAGMMCETCKGEGTIHDTNCPGCDGDGWIDQNV